MNQEELASRLYQRRKEAVLVEQLAPTHESAGRPAHCHENVREHLARYPDHKRVREWLIGNHGTFLYFNAHSLVETPERQWIDITPSHPPCPFLRHPDSDEKFDEIIVVTPRLSFELPPEEWSDHLRNIDLGEDESRDERDGESANDEY